MRLRNSILLLILITGLLFSAGCTGTKPAPATTPTPQMVNITVLVTPPSNISHVPTAKPTATSTKQIIYSTDEINKLFADIAFSNDFQTVTKFTNPMVKVSITGGYLADDVKTLSNFQQQFNMHSSTVQLPLVPAETNQGMIVFNFLPESSLNALAKDTFPADAMTKQIINRDENGKIGSIYRISVGSYASGILYLNSDLTGDARTHYITRGLLYYLGFVGQTGAYPDSIFYSGSNTTPAPNGIDWDVISLMYGSKIYNGMTLSDVRDALLITNTSP